MVRLPPLRRRRPALAGPRPLRPVPRLRRPPAVCAAAPDGPCRHGRGRLAGPPPARQPRHRPSGPLRPPCGRGHHRAARPRARHGRGHGARRASDGGALRQEPGGPSHLGAGHAGRPDGGRQPRGRQPRRASAAGEAAGDPGGRHRHRRVLQQPRRSGRRAAPVRGPRLGDSPGRRARPGGDFLRPVAGGAVPQTDAAGLPHLDRPQLDAATHRSARAERMATRRPSRQRRASGLAEAAGAPSAAG